MIVNSKRAQTMIFFEGDSLINWSLNNGVVNGRYVTQKAYGNVIASKSGISYTAYARSGWQLIAHIIPLIPTNITPYAQLNDIIVMQAGTNDIGSSHLSGADLFAGLLTYKNAIPSNVKLIVCTIIARDGASDQADCMTKIGDYNTLVRNNAATYGYTLCDPASDAMFDTIADCSNAANYDTDKIHILQPAQDLLASYISTSILSLLD